MTAKGVGELVRVEGSLTSEKYISTIVKSNYLYGPEMFFYQDNDPRHVSKITRDWLEKKNFKLINPPPNSPDLNPIENLWLLLKRKLHKRNIRGMSSNSLLVAATQEWARISKEVCQSLVKSMPTRIRAVLKEHGDSTTF